METERQIGALAQAARNFLLSGSDRDKAVLDRLAAEALGAETLWLRCLDCGALADENQPCPKCGLGGGANGLLRAFARARGEGIGR